MTLSISDNQHKMLYLVLSISMLNVVMLSVVASLRILYKI